MENNKSDMGGRIKAQLAAINKSQRDLATEVGITEVSLSRYIAGIREPNGSTLANLAKALHTTTDYLLGREVGNDFDSEFETTRAWIARNAKNMSPEQRMSLVGPLFQTKEG
ncbi:XRE family transcriptional regulator [Butyrivibrio sp. CB08]|uniref:helix-turn-helix domain-containing protein n=1 Tax=Butyrivibrio sp. CB08 TaxID=2364879 RepID=UPI000EAA3C78|nr:helix-turn-helix transcriptional regulator [Butyrivibrio sp. CB08]RKM55442.1 XRE family transcriptional regulator [Butyrivibrio sp. CB08]